MNDASPFVSRAGLKLDHALTTFNLDVTGLVVADFGCNTGGFVDCVLRRGASKVYAIDTGYGVLDYRLRKDPRVVVMERTNAMHVSLPDPVNLVTIDVAWTKQRNILPSAKRVLSPGGQIVTLIKPHYEADSTWLKRGILPDDKVDEVVSLAHAVIRATGFDIVATVTSPIKGAKGNTELLSWLRRTTDSPVVA